MLGMKNIKQRENLYTSSLPKAGLPTVTFFLFKCCTDEYFQSKILNSGISS